MKTILAASLAMLMLILAAPASAQCFADYKAKQDNPLRLQYGIVELPPAVCAMPDAAAAHVARVIGAHGWTLLQLESIFGQDDFQRRSANAGAIHLRQ